MEFPWKFTRIREKVLNQRCFRNWCISSE